VYVSRIGDIRNTYKILVGKPEGRRPFGRPRRRMEAKVRLDLREAGGDPVNWIHLAQDKDQ